MKQGSRPHRQSWTSHDKRVDSSRRALAPVSLTPLDDDRFQALLSQAQEFFAHAERDTVADKAAVIQEILDLMRTYHLSVDDLQDEG